MQYPQSAPWEISLLNTDFSMQGTAVDVQSIVPHKPIKLSLVNSYLGATWNPGISPK